MAKPLVSAPKSCETCIHFQTIALSSKKVTCSTLGFMPYSPPCQSYQPNGSGIRFLMPKIAEIMNSVNNDKDMATLIHLISARRRLVKHGGFRLMQKVVIRWRGVENYLSNFCYGYMLTVSVDGNNYQVVSRSGTTFMYVEKDSIYTMDDWYAIRDDLIKNGKIEDPGIKEMERAVQRAEKSGRHNGASYHYKPVYNGLPGLDAIRTRSDKATGPKRLANRTALPAGSVSGKVRSYTIG